MNVIKEFLLSYLATLGFVIMFSIPKEALFTSSLVGALGWTSLSIVHNFTESLIAGTFLASLLVGLLGETLARYNKKPATIYIIPGIIPLVPGSGMYYTMLALVENNFYEAAFKGTETLFVAASISIGLIISSTLSRSIKRVKFKS